MSFQTARRVLYRYRVALFGTLCLWIIMLHLPRPEWITALCYNEPVSKDTNNFEYLYYGDLNQLDIDSLREQSAKPDNFYIDKKNDDVLSMFPIYQRDHRTKRITDNNRIISEDFESTRVIQFTLQNLNLSNLSRTWTNTIYGRSDDLIVASAHQQECVVPTHTDHDLDMRGVYKALQSLPDLPDCVYFKVPIDRPPAAICVHAPDVDNFISNRLRDTGSWEDELLTQMEHFFRAHPDSQLVDLGSNIGVFSLYAASLGIPALAVDILPANLALLHLSMAVNDVIRAGVDVTSENILKFVREHQQTSHSHRTHATHTVHTMEESPRSSIKLTKEEFCFSQLITSVHNAIHSKRMDMYVCLKDDPNLGGTEVREQPDLQGNELSDFLNSLIQDNSISEWTRRKLLFDNSRLLDNRKVYYKRKLKANTHGMKKRIRKVDSGLKTANGHASNEMISKISNVSRQARNSFAIKSQTSTNINSDSFNAQNTAEHDLKNNNKPIKVHGICLDDLIPYLRPRKGVFLKIDIEGSETNVFKCASRFFSEVDVRGILMEMMFHKMTAAGREMADSLMRRNLLPSEDARGRTLLNLDTMASWPDNVFWVRAR